MITEMELNDAIRKFEEADDPNSNTCITLAAFYTVRDHMFPTENVQYSNASGAGGFYTSDTEFGKMISEKNPYAVMTVIDELMTTLNVLNPHMYTSVMDRLSDAK